MTTEVTEMTIDEQLDSLRSDVAHLADLKRVHADFHEDLRAEHERAIAVLAARLRDLESFKAQTYMQIEILTGRVRELRETRQADDTDRYVELRRALLVVGLTEILIEWTKSDPSMEWDKLDKIRWQMPCAELYHRYGHLQFDGKPLWASPPKAPSPETRQLIAESLRRRQEA